MSSNYPFFLGVTYGNVCELQIEKCKNNKDLDVANDGECCPELCTDDWDPVCGTNGKS